MKIRFGKHGTILMLGILTLWCRGAFCGDLKALYGFDRMRAIESFLDVMYPELQHENGLLTFRTREFNIRGDDLRVSFVRCHVGSGVPGGGVQLKSPNCDGLYESGTSEFLHLSIRTGTGAFPIRNFQADGSFFGRREEVLTKMKGHPEWSAEQVLDALHQAQPKFGPDGRELFLQAVPAALVYKFSGCRLVLGEAKFDPTGLVWYIPGKNGHGRKGYPCNAQFDPIGGGLVSISQL